MSFVGYLAHGMVLGLHRIGHAVGSIGLALGRIGPTVGSIGLAPLGSYYAYTR